MVVRFFRHRRCFPSTEKEMSIEKLRDFSIVWMYLCPTNGNVRMNKGHSSKNQQIINHQSGTKGLRAVSFDPQKERNKESQK